MEQAAEIEQISILIVDDHPVVRQGLRAMLSSEPDFVVMGMAASAREALSLLEHKEPDVVLMDLRMPEMEGTEAIVELRRIRPNIRILVLTNYGSDEYIVRATQAGAMGYLLKNTPQGEIVTAVRMVYRSERYVPKDIAQRLFEAIGREELSPRELEVLSLVAQGCANKDVAQRLFISDKTVRNHVTSCLLKLQAKDRTEAVTRAIERGLIRIQE
ncbi:MAG: response regulator transcription factor [Edaphobacter sp.]|uniref:response regulator transcription factor n=1 Tax=Edaphobacter sp. TaxID=1934404 RepID=UPI00239F77AD|nr:response regulator transcription factor [Edaphobacter sp.]MDE1178233.1 response regulator transcription factor [Edaphobacter sp.]